MPENLIESELFGYEKGAFTGANKTTVGKVETANEGTLLLDENGDIPLNLQSKLLRFLQERVIERVGGRSEIPVDVRVICATNKDLQKMVSEGTFREDLFYRICEMTVDIPPLRLRHGPDGHDLQPAVTCSCCKAPVRSRDVTFEIVEATPARRALAS